MADDYGALQSQINVLQSQVQQNSTAISKNATAISNVVTVTGAKDKGVTIICQNQSPVPKVSLKATTKDTIISKHYSSNGLVCDISNKYGVPFDLDKIAAYFSNRDTYELTLRGNPALDVGDYIWLSLEDDDDASTYKKALILESELVFDGSFKETLKVRVIDNDFEPISGNTHADLSKYTHTKLSGYTHKQLMTEAIQ